MTGHGPERQAVPRIKERIIRPRSVPPPGGDMLVAGCGTRRTGTAARCGGLPGRGVIVVPPPGLGSFASLVDQGMEGTGRLSSSPTTLPSER